MSQVSIKKDDNGITLDIKTDKEFSLYRVTVDIAVHQFDIIDGVIGSIFSTKVYQENLPVGLSKLNLSFGSKVGSLPQFVKNGESTGYVWVNSELTSVNFEKKDKDLIITFKVPQSVDASLELPLPEEGADGLVPKVLYK